MRRSGRRCWICGEKEGAKIHVRIGIEKRWVHWKCYLRR